MRLFVVGSLAPGIVALVLSLVHALRFTACLEEIPLEVAGGWAVVTSVVTIPAGVVAAVVLVVRRSAMAAEVARSLGWANVVAAAVALLTFCVAVWADDRDAARIFSVASAVAGFLAGSLLLAVRLRSQAVD